MTKRRRWNIGKAFSENHEHFKSIVIGVLWAFDDEDELYAWLRDYGFKLSFEPNEALLGANLIRLLLDEHDPLSLVLRAHLYLENILEALIREKFPQSELLLKNRDFTFSMKLDVLRAKNYLDRFQYSDIKRINTIRNRFAHELRFDFAAVNFAPFSYCEYIDGLPIERDDVRRAVNVYMFKNIVFWLLAQLTKRHPFLGQVETPV